MSHAPPGYECPFCRIGQRADFVSDDWNAPEDVVLRDDALTAFIAPSQWPRNPGHVVIVPNEHYENLYDLPDEIGARIHAASRRLALAMKSAYGCAGTSTRQHNEPAGNQEVWHYHLHVFPRFARDRLYTSRKGRVAADARARQARTLRAALESGEIVEATVISLESPFTAAAAELFREGIAELERRYGSGVGVEDGFELESLRDERSAFVGVRIAERLVGCGVLWPREEKSAEVKRMYVRPGARRRGLGRQILVRLETEAIERGFRTLRLETGVLQPEAIELYESSGYRRIARFEPWTDNPSSLCYAKEL